MASRKQRREKAAERKQAADEQERPRGGARALSLVVKDSKQRSTEETDSFGAPGRVRQDKWEAFVPINYAFPDADKINALVDEYATEHEVQNPPLEAR